MLLCFKKFVPQILIRVILFDYENDIVVFGTVGGLTHNTYSEVDL